MLIVVLVFARQMRQVAAAVGEDAPSRGFPDWGLTYIPRSLSKGFAAKTGGPL